MRKKKTAIVTARMTPEVKQRLQERALDANMTLTQYLIICGLGQEIVRVDGLDAVLSDLKAQGRNLNRLGGRGISQYVAHEAEEFEKLVKSGYCEDGEMTFQEYANRWLERQTKYAPSTLGFYCRSLETVYPMIGSIRLNKLRPIALENLLVELRKRIYHGKPIQEATVQKYLTVVSAVLNDAKRNEIIEKNPARIIDLPDTICRVQLIPTDAEAHRFLDILANEEDPYKTFYALAIYTGCRRGELCALK